MNRAMSKFWSTTVLSFIILALFGNCVFRPLEFQKVENWPFSATWDTSDKSKPVARLIVKKPQAVQYFLMGETEVDLKEVAGLPVEQFGEIVRQKLIESGLFRDVVVGKDAKADLDVEVFYYESYSKFGVYELISAFTLTVLPLVNSSYQIVNVRVQEKGKIRGEATSFEKKFYIYQLPLTWIPGLFYLTAFEPGKSKASLEKGIEAAFQNAMDQELFAWGPQAKQKPRIQYYGRVIKLEEKIVIVSSMNVNGLKPGKEISLHQDGSPTGKMVVRKISGKGFHAELVSGKPPYLGQLVGD